MTISRDIQMPDLDTMYDSIDRGNMQSPITDLKKSKSIPDELTIAMI